MVWGGRRAIPVLLASATLLPILALGWLGFRVLGQERELARQRERERLEIAAARLALAVERRLGEIEEQLRRGEGLRLTASGFEGSHGGLLYQPAAAGARETADAGIAAAEAQEYARGDLGGAAAAYRQLAQSGRPETRAAALIRLGRVLRKQGDPAGARDAYERLLALGHTAVSGQPAELLARQGLCRMWEEAHDPAALANEARELARRLYSEAWRIDRATFELYREMAERWRGPPPPREAMAKTEAAITLWRNWREGTLAPRGRRVMAEGAEPVLAVWSGESGAVTGWLAAHGELGAVFGPLWKEQGLKVWLQDAMGQVMLGQRTAGGVTLTPGESRLPFVLGVAPAEGSGQAGSHGSGGRILLGGLLLTAGFTLAAAYGLYRTTSREMALARQQADFVSAVSHEFRTPLTSMRHLTELLVRRGAPNEERRSYYYQLLAGETERLHRMVESLLSFGRIEAGAYAWHLQRADAGELVGGIVAEFRKDAQAKEREISCVIEEGLPPIEADREALSRALWNLLENAVKYSQAPGRIEVRARRSGDSVRIEVADEGAGIPPEEQSAVFQKFVRGAAAKREGIRGAGIGLALVKKIIEGHGGSVELESAPGRGSRFTLVLPCHAS
jgi:signal transduction histidine kinase